MYSLLSKLFQQFKRRFFYLLSRYTIYFSDQFNYLQPTIQLPFVWFGGYYTGFFVHPTYLNKDSIIYCFGVGDDISFELEIISLFDCNIYSFDPTPYSIQWISSQNIPNQVQFFPFGISDKTVLTNFYLPKEHGFISGSEELQSNVDGAKSIQVPMKKLVDIMSDLHHQQIDLLKLDIEGSEYRVLDEILESQIPIHQIVVEFHDRFFDDGSKKTEETIRNLNEHGFEIFAVSHSLEEVSFINRNYAY